MLSILLKKQTTILAIVGIIFSQGCFSSFSDGRQIRSTLNTSQIKQALHQQHKSWRGVQYRMGGTSKKGVDCSGFVYRTFKDQIGVVIPRTTELQSELGMHVSRDQLKPGDLIFFKTGSIFKDRHVGIYAGNGKFIHASTSRGVMQSSLNNPYWKDAYWQSRRILK